MKLTPQNIKTSIKATYADTKDIITSLGIVSKMASASESFSIKEAQAHLEHLYKDAVEVEAVKIELMAQVKKLTNQLAKMPTQTKKAVSKSVANIKANSIRIKANKAVKAVKSKAKAKTTTKPKAASKT
jgi:predicted  nucleic acid-binding Zn-ribbon protein